MRRAMLKMASKAQPQKIDKEQAKSINTFRENLSGVQQGKLFYVLKIDKKFTYRAKI